MTTQQTPTYVGWFKDTGFWGFSPSPMPNAYMMWDITSWTFQDVQELMELPTDKDRIIRLVQQVGLPIDMLKDTTTTLTEEVK